MCLGFSVFNMWRRKWQPGKKGCCFSVDHCVCTTTAKATAKAIASDQLLCLETSQRAIPNALTKDKPVFVRGKNLFQMPWRNLRHKTVMFALLLSTDLL